VRKENILKTSKQTLARFGKKMKSSKIASVLIAIVALFAGVQSVGAQTQTSACMNDVWNAAGKTGNLVCTAKEVYISENPDGSKIIEATIVNGDGCQYPGDTATVDIVASLHFNTDRYDIGIYSSADGGNGYRGTCYVTYIPLTEGYSPPVWNFDGAGDLCADVNTAVGGNDLAGFTFQRMTLTCQDLDNDGFLDFATCFSWRTSGNNALCDAVGDLYPGTKSKCFCERVNINVPVPKASITVTKTATPTSVNEPGANVTFNVSIKNDSIDPANIVYIDTLTDVYTAI
jgi:hypothetical protein